jgi:hypothetical protein
MPLFWGDVAHCSLVEIDRRFGSLYCLHYEGDGKMDIIIKLLKYI